MINLEEVKETNRDVNAEKGVSTLKYERQGIYKYIINEEKGVVVCVFDHGMKRALSKIYLDYTHIMSKSIFWNYNAPCINASDQILKYPHSWDTYLKKVAANERNAFLTDNTISNMIIKQIRKNYGKNIAKMPEFKGIAKCNTEVDSFDEEFGKKLATYRMLKKFEIFKYKCIHSYIWYLTETLLSMETEVLHFRNRNNICHLMDEINSMAWGEITR